jgi:Domain of Unknown Function with PDB structure (DUF3857)/Transglutaminase-like superfamily
MVTRAFLLGAVCAFGHIAAAVDVPVSLAPASDWVVPLHLPPNSDPPADQADADSWLLLEDCQINAGTGEVFNHVARQMLTKEGAQHHSQLSIDFDTNHQSLVLHWVRIWRESNALNGLDLRNISVLQRNKNSDGYLFDGNQTAALALQDMHEGDILDYAYTIRGANPVGGGKFSHLVTVREHEPVERLTTRLLWPKAKTLFIKNKGTDAAPVIVKKGDVTEYTWDFKNVEGLEDEEPMPVWYFPLPWVQLTEFKSWAEVNQWATNTFATGPVSAELARQINAWRDLPEAEQRVVTVLRFLQDEVRNQSDGAATEAYKPASPSAVFARRFGDAKDKALLLTTILRTLGIEASPVLVSSELRQTLQDWLPTASEFDHAVVKVTVEGRSYWLDPTESFQRGPLAARAWPNYGRGLVVHAGTTELELIPEAAMQPKTLVTEYFMVRQAVNPTDLKVVTVVDGPDADNVRKQFAATGRAGWQARAFDSLAGFYSGLTIAAPLDYVDNEDQNEIVTTEYYQIARIWQPSPPGIGFQCRFFPENILPLVQKPTVSYRSMPLGLIYPKHEIFRARIQMAVFTPIDVGDRTIDNPALFFHKVVTAPNGVALLEEEFDSRTDAVPVDAMSGYMQQLSQIYDLTGFSIFSY